MFSVHELRKRGARKLNPSAATTSTVATMRPALTSLFGKGRAHADFLTRIPIRPNRLKNLIRGAWSAAQPAPCPPVAAIDRLVQTRYSRSDWNFKY